MAIDSSAPPHVSELRKSLLLAVAALAASVLATGAITASVYALHVLTQSDPLSAERE